MHYAKVVGIFQTLHPGRTTISVLQGLGYFFFLPVSFKCVISLSWSSGYELHSTEKDELGLAGVAKGSVPGPLCPQSFPKWACITCRSSSVTPLAYLGAGKTCGGGEELKSGLERSWKWGCEPWATDAERAARAGGWWDGEHTGVWANTWHTLGWEKPCKT